MPSSNKTNAPKRGYSRISLRKKIMLVKLIFRRSTSFEDAIAQLGIKKTTAINIVKRYKETGSFPVRKYRRITKAAQQQQSSLSQQIVIKEQQSASKNSSEQPSVDNSPQALQAPFYPPFYPWMYYPGVFYAPY